MKISSMKTILNSLVAMKLYNGNVRSTKYYGLNSATNLDTNKVVSGTSIPFPRYLYLEKGVGYAGPPSFTIKSENYFWSQVVW